MMFLISFSVNLDMFLCHFIVGRIPKSHHLYPSLQPPYFICIVNHYFVVFSTNEFLRAIFLCLTYLVVYQFLSWIRLHPLFYHRFPNQMLLFPYVGCLPWSQISLVSVKFITYFILLQKTLKCWNAFFDFPSWNKFCAEW